LKYEFGHPWTDSCEGTGDSLLEATRKAPTILKVSGLSLATLGCNAFVSEGNLESFVVGQCSFAIFVTMPLALTPPPLTLQLFLDFLVFPVVAPQFLCQQVISSHVVPVFVFDKMGIR